MQHSTEYTLIMIPRMRVKPTQLYFYPLLHLPRGPHIYPRLVDCLVSYINIKLLFLGNV